MSRIPSSSRAGVALISVLAIVVFLAVIVVAFTTTMTRDRQAAFYFGARERATLMSGEALEVVKAKLLTAFDQRDATIVTQPGRLMIASAANPTWETIELSSGPDATGADLNRVARSEDGEPIIDPNSGPMALQWIYVRRNGTREPGGTPSYAADNPLIGRYAFWVDDETTRVNLNTARERVADPDSDLDPALISIEAIDDSLTPADANLIADQTDLAELLTPAGASRILPDKEEILSTNRFALTHRSYDADLNPFGEPKIVLTTQRERPTVAPIFKFSKALRIPIPALLPASTAQNTPQPSIPFISSSIAAACPSCRAAT